MIGHQVSLFKVFSPRVLHAGMLSTSAVFALAIQVLCENYDFTQQCKHDLQVKVARTLKTILAVFRLVGGQRIYSLRIYVTLPGHVFQEGQRVS